jgi:hypothetical protein
MIAVARPMNRFFGTEPLASRSVCLSKVAHQARLWLWSMSWDFPTRRRASRGISLAYWYAGLTITSMDLRRESLVTYRLLALLECLINGGCDC